MDTFAPMRTPNEDTLPSPSSTEEVRMNARFANKVAIVTGGSRGLGRGVVEVLAGGGAKVVALARTRAQLEELSSAVPEVETVAADITDEATAERLLREKDPDLVVLCAGAMPVLGAFHELSWSQFCVCWEVDTRGTFVWLKQALQKPLKRGAHVVVISSGAALGGSPVSGGYASAKRAQWFLASYAATEIERANLGLRVHCLLPNINPSTELGRAGIAAYARRAGVSDEEFANRFGPPLTPAILGSVIAELFENPDKFDQLAYRVGGGGLAKMG